MVLGEPPACVVMGVEVTLTVAQRRRAPIVGVAQMHGYLTSAITACHPNPVRSREPVQTGRAANPDAQRLRELEARDEYRTQQVRGLAPGELSGFA